MKTSKFNSINKQTEQVSLEFLSKNAWWYKTYILNYLAQEQSISGHSRSISLYCVWRYWLQFSVGSNWKWTFRNWYWLGCSRYYVNFVALELIEQEIPWLVKDQVICVVAWNIVRYISQIPFYEIVKVRYSLILFREPSNYTFTFKLSSLLKTSKLYVHKIDSGSVKLILK